MKIKLSREERIELLKAVQSGVLEPLRIPRICDIIQDSNAFLELMKLCDENDNEQS